MAKRQGESGGCGMDEVEGAELRETGRLIRGGACTCPAVVTERRVVCRLEGLLWIYKVTNVTRPQYNLNIILIQ